MLVNKHQGQKEGANIAADKQAEENLGNVNSGTHHIHYVLSIAVAIWVWSEVCSIDIW